MNPIELFKKWYSEESERTHAPIPSACCLSTTGLDGYPNARFVSLKEICYGEFIITGTLDSKKGIEIERNHKVALTFWWAETQRQVKVQGEAETISDLQADTYFSDRNTDSQIVSVISEQGKPIDNIDILRKEFQKVQSKYKNKPVPRPVNWGGFSIRPVRIEFMEFKPTRLHNRKLYERKSDSWFFTQVQP